jgi:2,3-bisphosphoglycerate-independent phosphoglycerate mutase
MVGHTGSMAATVVAIEALDLMLARLAEAVEALDGALVITADHGNADEMYQHRKDGHVERDGATGAPMVKTSHSLNPVPFIVFHPGRGDRYEVVTRPGAGIASATATCLELLGFAPPADLEPSLLRFRCSVATRCSPP